MENSTTPPRTLWTWRDNWEHKLAQIEIDPGTKNEIVDKLKIYLAEELNIELGSFDAQFLLGFFIDHVGYKFYNQGLADALKAFGEKLEEFNDLVYQLEKEGPSSS